MNKRHELERMAQEIDLDLRAVRQALRRPAETEFARGGLTGPQRSVMQALGYSDGMSLKDLSRQVGLAHSTVSGIVDRLERRGLLARRAAEADGRVSLIAVTEKVRDFMERTLPALVLHPLVEALRPATPAERARVVEGLKTLRRLVDEPSTRSGKPSL